MKRLFLVSLLVAMGRTAHAQDPTALAQRLAERIARAPARAVGLYYRSLTGPDSLLIGANLRFHAASTMKVPVMIQIFRDADAGLLTQDRSEERRVGKECRSRRWRGTQEKKKKTTETRRRNI